MKKTSKVCLLCLFLSVVVLGLLMAGCLRESIMPPRSVTNHVIFVSPAGSDRNPGTEANPLETLEAAIAMARGSQGVTIWLAGGTYNPAGTINLTVADSGTEGAPLTIRGMEGQEVIFTRGDVIDTKLFSKVEDRELLSRLHESARGQVWSASLAGTGLEAKFPYRPDELLKESYALVSWDGCCLQQAQWPNRGYDYIAETLEAGPTTRWLEKNEKPADYSWDKPTGAVFKLRGKLDLEMLKREFDRTGDVWVAGYHNNDWFFQKENLGAVDAENATLQLLRYTRYGVGNDKLPLPRRVRLVNVLGQLDEPGEWYYDHHDKRFYVWPVQPLTDDKPISVAGGDIFIKGRGVNHVTVRNIIFEGFGDEGLSFEGCDHILIGGCTFRIGVDLGLRLVDGMHNTITGCDFHDLYRAFLLLGKYPTEREYQSQYEADINLEFNKVTFSENRYSLIQEHNVASNNHIYDCRLRGYGLAACGGVGVKFTHNLMHNVNGGMMYGHNDFLAEYNEFYDCGYEMGDWNVCYCGADLSYYNNMFRFNFVHHFMETPKGHPMSAWRADDNASGLRTFGNIYYKCGRSAVQGNGPDYMIQNSVAIGTPYLWWTVQKPYEKISIEQFLADKAAERIKTNEEIAAGVRSLYDKLNIIGRAEMVFGREGWKNNETWIEKYPHLPKIFGDDFMNKDSNPYVQCYNLIQYNYSDVPSYKAFHIHGRNPMDSLQMQRDFLPATATLDAPVKVDTKAMFVDADKMDFRMRDDFTPMDSFEPIPFEKIGLYLDEYRRSMPDKTAYRQAVRAKYKGVSSYKGNFDYDKLNERYSAPEYLEGVK